MSESPNFGDSSWNGKVLNTNSPQLDKNENIS